MHGQDSFVFCGPGFGASGSAIVAIVLCKRGRNGYKLKKGTCHYFKSEQPHKGNIVFFGKNKTK